MQIKIPSPEKCGLPANFTHWRSSQEKAIADNLTNPKRVTALCAPCGFGKSLVVMAIALLSKVPTCIVTSSKGLQTQYLEQFEQIGLVDIRGKSNYQCEAKEDHTCEDGHAARCPYKGTVTCPYSQAEMRAATSNIVVTNYDKWIAAKRFGQGMEHFQQVVFDEGHHSSEALARALQVMLNYSEIEDKLKLSFPPANKADNFEVWKPWAVIAKETAVRAMHIAKARIDGVRDPKSSWVRHYHHMRNLARRLAIISTGRATDWVVDEVPDKGYIFDPVAPARYAESHLLLKVPRISVVSATLRPKSLYMMGIKKSDFQFSEYDSDFDPKRCPIYYIPTMRVDNKNLANIGLLWLKLDQIIARRRHWKGIVQTISFGRANDILNTSRFSESMMVNERGEPPTETIEAFKASAAGTILVSPSVGTGYDFPDDECRFQFMCKIPFEPPSKIVKAREAADKEYRGYRAMQTLVQQFGRHVRSKTDFGESFICDEHLTWFLPRYGHLAPKSFHAFIKEVQTVPPPLNL